MIVAKGGSSKMNAYAHIALGNVWLEQLFNPARKREDVSQFIQIFEASFIKRFQGRSWNKTVRNSRIFRTEQTNFFSKGVEPNREKLNFQKSNCFLF